MFDPGQSNRKPPKTYITIFKPDIKIRILDNRVHILDNAQSHTIQS